MLDKLGVFAVTHPQLGNSYPFLKTLLKKPLPPLTLLFQAQQCASNLIPSSSPALTTQYWECVYLALSAPDWQLLEGLDRDNGSGP